MVTVLNTKKEKKTNSYFMIAEQIPHLGKGCNLQLSLKKISNYELIWTNKNSIMQRKFIED